MQRNENKWNVICIRLCLFLKSNIIWALPSKDILNIKRIIRLWERTLHYADCHTFIRKFNWDCKERVDEHWKFCWTFAKTKGMRSSTRKQQLFFLTEFNCFQQEIKTIMSFSMLSRTSQSSEQKLKIYFYSLNYIH